MLEVRLRHALPAFRLDVAFEAPGGITALFGRSGAGKTTVVNAVAGLLRPDWGRIALDGRVLLDTAARVAVPRHRRRVGYVFQEGRLFPHLSVRQNLLFGRWFAPRDAPGADLAGVVELLGIGPLLGRAPAALSGGEKQRVAIGRALLARPRLLLMDEPLASLDEPRKDEILPFLLRLRDEVRVPIVYVSHSVAEVARIATTVVAVSDGRVARVGPAAEVLGATDLFPVMGRQEAGALLTARLVGHAPEDGLSELAIAGGRLWVPEVAAAPGEVLRVRIRARDVMLALRPPEAISALNVLPVTVTAIGDADGAIAEVGLDCAGDRLLARVTGRSLRALGLAPGARAWAVVKTVAVGRRDIVPAD